MEKFELNPTEYPLGKRIKKELSLLALLIIILLFFVGINVVYLTTVLFMYTLLLLLKRNRIIYKIEFNDSTKELKLFYYYLIFFRGSENINYHKTVYKMSLKRYGFGSAIETLELFKGKILVGEIRKEGKWKWTEDNINNLDKKLTIITNSKIT
ncbi:hypothetical protein BZG02_19415 [Labilibaculum filiforme]|uniref:Uncharacterized protein n=1 Tax=Labilibaculum filiforme TaxID=1940526 RepID=A0A2N3HQV9_9BACT|nr:hypothetical protein [Labilibaculum filiforme]PKQ60433.1 hypothetical protein BZG02_19415 [Labilibaculum filiforme]